MASLGWQANYELGQPTIDAQHRKWFEITNDFLKEVGQGAVTSESVQNALRDFIEYSNQHFSAEEQFMRDIGYAQDSLQEHAAVHDEFVGKINELAAQCRDGKAETVQEMINFMTSWLRHHIVATDIRYIRLFRRVGPKVSAVATQKLRKISMRKRRRK